ncbi:hypothetical protein GCM10009127_06360 [Alteraurantiacibacter aestuarii]|uniref:Sulfotransferase family protein n=1 Tax=Alteraurantiacibacter aestuarii TaxID=650004 RepID=A0A844ZNJ4_9SPHN|nr:sulfotransferase [Alteraurantiacibacter aestuarii]MXO89114.1 hypothetical protein [Alteraurantiacibacter aestuarii]
MDIHRKSDSEQAAVLGLVDGLRPAIERHDRAEVVGIIAKLLALRAPMGEQWLALAKLAGDRGEITSARAALELFVDFSGRSAMALYQQAAVLAQLGLWNDARAILSALPAGQPEPAALAHSSGTAALAVGDTAEARRMLEEATRLRPASGPTWHSLSTMIDYVQEPQEADRLLAAERQMAFASQTDFGIYLYALGKMHADRGEHERAFAAFSRGARLTRPAGGYDPDRDSRIARDAIDGYDPRRMAQIAAQQGEPTGRTIFVTGLPRSGTTLVEQILTAHSEVADGGEINRLGLLASDMGGNSFEALERHVAREGAPALARLWDHWLAERFGAQGRIVDKTIGTSRLLGIAASLLPQAPLVWLRRDPLDCAWSCFRTRFNGSYPWSHDLEDIAHHFALEDALLRQWQDLLGDRLLVMDYETLVSEPATAIARLLAHCDLAPESQAFAPHENRHVVATSSVMQVRQPISRSAIGSAQPYAQFLTPFSDAYYGKGAPSS